ncbi:g13043 [Coccomyxa viridis]|uniref:G13043 protein n=1 Tax=Coccomyxa viridis TaxID=1274662 RepID=A0ABP1GFZ6_9CHLO
MLMRMVTGFASSLSRSRNVLAAPPVYLCRMQPAPRIRPYRMRFRSSMALSALQASPSASLEEESQGFPASSEPEIREVDFDPRLVNSVGLLGRLGSPFSLRRINDRYTVASANLAVSRGSKKDGQEPQTDWFTLEVWNKLAELTSQQLDKGMQIQVVGRLKTETWTDKVTNQPRKTIKIVADQVNRVRSIGQGYGYGDVQRMQAPQPDMWEQQNAAQQPQSMPAPPPPPPAQEDDFVGGSSQSFFGEMPPRGANVGVAEKKWMEFFDNPNAYWDNRQNKRNPRAPDFKHKDEKDTVLWLDSRDTPSWVPAQMQKAGMEVDNDQIPF